MSPKESYGKSVDPATRALRHVSVSSLTSFDPSQYGGCNRAFWWSKVMGRDRAKSDALDIGIDVHSQIEHYLRTGEDTLGVIARQGKHFIPEPGPDLLIEHSFGDGKVVRAFEQWRTIKAAVAQHQPGATPERAKAWYQENIPANALHTCDVPFIGYIDLIHQRDHWIDTEGQKQAMPPRSAEVVDWKTSSNIELYGKSHLEETIQMVGYAEWARRQWPYLEKLRLSHGYFQTRGRAAEKRTVLITLDTVEKRWQHIERQVQRMTEVVRETDVNRIEPNYDACNAYGRLGCPHKEVCPRDPERTLVDLLGGPHAMSMMSMITPTTNDTPITTGCGDPNCHAPITSQNSFAGDDGIRWHMTQTPHKVPAQTAMFGTPAPAPAPAQAPGSSTGLMSMFSAAAPAPAPAPAAPAPAAPAPAPAPARQNVAFSDQLVLRHRERGYCVKILRNPQTGQWWFCSINQNGTLGEPSMTAPEQWFADIWVESAPPPPPTNTIVPPDAPVSLPPQNAAPIPVGTTLPPAVAAAAAAAAAFAPEAPVAPAPSNGTAPTNGALAEVPAKRTRKKSTTATAPDAAPAATFTGEGVVLLVNMSQVQIPDAEVTDLEPYVADMARRLAEHFKLDDIRLAGPDHVLGYNKWKAAFAVAIAKNKLAPGVYSLNHVTESEFKQIAVEALRPLATGGFLRGS